MKRIFLALMLLCASPCFAQLVLTANLAGQVNAPIDQNGWQSFKVTLTQNITFSFVILPLGTPPPAQSTLRVIFVQDAVGSRTVTFASNIVSPCTISAGANVTTICQFAFDSTSSTWIGIGGGGASSLGAAPNIKTFGAVGNGKFFVDGASSASNSNLTSSQATFSASDVNQKVTCISAGPTVAINNRTISAFVNSGTVTYSGATIGTVSGMFCSFTNPADPAAILNAFNACKTTSNSVLQGTSFQQPACFIYLPAGIYGISNTLDNLITTGNEGCVGIIGDGANKSVLIPTANFTSTNVANGGFLINDRCSGAYLKDFTIEMASIPFSAGNTSGIINITSGHSFLENVWIFDECVSAGTLYGISTQAASGTWIRPNVTSSGSCGGTQGGMLINNGGNLTIINPFLSNTQQNLQITNTLAGSNGVGLNFFGGIIDEGSITSIQNSVDVWFNGTTLTGGANCISVDATSFVWLTGGYCGTFGAGTGGGPTVASGGVLNMTQVHVNAVNAGSACYTSAAYGGIVDDGTNRCTTSGGGTVYPSGGFTNKTSLSHLPFNAFQTGTLTATTNLQTFVVDQPVQIQTFSWTPNNAFACTAGSFPTFSMSDGTVTVTTAATDTSASGTVTHTFANTTASILNPAGTVGAVLTVKVVTTGTCGTAPTNVNINVWGQATAPGV